jgi:hypothetical protein
MKPRDFLQRALTVAVNEYMGEIYTGQEQYAVEVLDRESAYSELYRALEAARADLLEHDREARSHTLINAALAHARGEK